MADLQEMAMERFFTRKYRRYLQILVNPRDEVQRRMILSLLAEEKAALKREGAPEKEAQRREAN